MSVQYLCTPFILQSVIADQILDNNGVIFNQFVVNHSSVRYKKYSASKKNSFAKRKLFSIWQKTVLHHKRHKCGGYQIKCGRNLFIVRQKLSWLQKLLFNVKTYLHQEKKTIPQINLCQIETILVVEITPYCINHTSLRKKILLRKVEKLLRQVKNTPLSGKKIPSSCKKKYFVR